jgi:signal transduction histidine kinase
MKVCVLSKNLKLFNLCRDVIRALTREPKGEPYEVVLLDPDHASDVEAQKTQTGRVGADLLIWDLDDVKWSNNLACPSASDTAEPTETQDQVFVVSRRQAAEFLRSLPLGAGNTLLKPVNRATLQIFVEQAAARARSRQSAGQAASADQTASDRPDLLQCLLMANLKLQVYDQDRTNFLARAVHDFRAPLMAASGYCGLLLEGALGPLNAEQMESLHRMQHSLRKLTRMASAMFQLSVGKQVERKLDLKPSSIETCIHHAAQEVGPLAGEKKITITLKLAPPKDPLFLDAEQMEQVLVNLLENACKFTPKGGQIEVRAYPVGSGNGHVDHSERRVEGDRKDGYRVDISDTGTGIAPEHLEAVFEEYTSYSGSQDRSGGGLGLAICKMILTEHGGRVWAENHAAGARLSLVLPLSHLSSRRRSDVRADSKAKRAAS